MEFRPAVLDDAVRIDRYLRARSETSMFLRSNLRAFGPCGGDAQHATQMWLLEDGQRLTGVLGFTTGGFVLVQLPEGAPSGSLRRLLGGERIKAILGESDQVTRARTALGLDHVHAQLDDDEPLYALDLARLRVPPGESRLRKAVAEDRKRLIAWREEYLVETVYYSPEDAIATAPGEIDAMMARGTLMVLELNDGTPCAMTSFNAILPDMVQVGNVFTADELRGQGHARRAVALHLQRARTDGVERAILFASGPAASRAYEAIGFEQIGHFTLLIFRDPQPVGAPA
ncbi:GNAT family N-acetyltransferase [Tropicimonas marinistellae]|uniref:GNAT family N-acetyltransferase n=1 Tax=Tropicimonas marinistellae TaxID=1739787 RepID=UPI0008378AB5|nr:GNAT family N-acetyltransferase [Tropicimonas marinistellae]